MVGLLRVNEEDESQKCANVQSFVMRGQGWIQLRFHGISYVHLAKSVNCAGRTGRLDVASFRKNRCYRAGDTRDYLLIHACLPFCACLPFYAYLNSQTTTIHFRQKNFDSRRLRSDWSADWPRSNVKRLRPAVRSKQLYRSNDNIDNGIARARNQKRSESAIRKVEARQRTWNFVEVQKAHRR